MDLGNSISLLFCIPFLGMLLSIAVFPLVKPAWWERNQKYAVIAWSLLFLIPFAIRYGFGVMGEQLLEVIVGDYFTFIVLLFGLFCLAGNITIEGELSGSPKVNVIMLLIGTLLSSWIGTTGASMVMIRPLIRANKWRSRKTQVVVFFIFLVSNIGGCLTPVGDPPLLMGFMRNVPFFWSLRLIPIMILNVAILLVIFYILDSRAYRKDLADGIVPEAQSGRSAQYHFPCSNRSSSYFKWCPSVHKSIQRRYPHLWRGRAYICSSDRGRNHFAGSVPFLQDNK